VLVAMAGLPGAGKSAVADALGKRLGTTVVSVDPIESAILSAGIDAGQPTGLAAYLVAERMAEAVLGSGASIIVDAVNAVEPARYQWRELARRTGVPVLFVEVVCTDAAEHRRRLEARRRDLPGMSEVRWPDVEQILGEYADWTGESGAVQRVTVDSMRPVEDLVDDVLGRLIA
jgi:predicted kinase